MNINKAIIVGRITQDLELKAMPNGNFVLNFTVATNYVWKDKDGNKQEETEFHNVVSFGNQAETIAKYFVKGQEIFCEGRLKTQSWDDKETQKKMYRTEIILEKFEFGQKPQTASQEQPTTVEQKKVEYPTNDVAVEDIPF